MGRPTAFRHRLRRALKDTAGGVMIYFSIMLPILFGFVGLASDVAMWHMHSRIVGMMTDSAAFSTALEVMRASEEMQDLMAGYIDPTPEQIREARAPVLLAVATAQAEMNGFDAAAGDTIEVYSPPRSGPRMDDPRAVEVVISRNAPILFGALVGGEDATVSDRAVAVRGATNCVVALNETANGAILASGQANAVFPCGIHSNSANFGVMLSGSNAEIHAETVDVVGRYSGDKIYPTPTTGAPVEPDPFDGRLEAMIPDYSLQCAVNWPGGINWSEGDPPYTVDPAALDPCDEDDILVIGSDVAIDSDDHVHFAPGIYIVTRNINVSGQAVVTGTGVTFIFEKGRIDVSGGASINFSAPTTGPLAGMLIVQHPDFTNTNSHALSGGSYQLLDGVVYFPDSKLVFSGGSETEKTKTMLIADTIQFSGNTRMAAPMDGAAGSNMALIAGLQALLVE